MDLFQNIVITDLYQPVTVYSPHGRQLEVKNRKDYGLSFCIDGEIIYEQNGQKYVSNQNNAILLPLGHSYRLYGSKTGHFTLINFQCGGLVCDHILQIPIQDPAPFIRDFEQMKALYPFGSNRLQIFSLFYETLGRLALQQRPQYSILKPALIYLEENLSDPELSNQILAQQANVSEVYFRKLFLAHYRMSPRQYILGIRIQKAQQLLIGNAHSVSEVAELCGFSSVYHFCRMFKNKTGFTPTQFAGKNRSFSI